MAANADLAKTRVETFKEALNKAKGSLSQIAARHITPERLMKVALGAATRNPQLLECTPASLVRAIMQGAELGLEPGSALNHAYLVPFKNTKTNPHCWEAQLIVSAQGMAELAYRSGLVSFISVEVVYEGDIFEYEQGLEPKLRHVPSDLTVDADKITHAYMVVGLKDGSKVFRVMGRKALDRIKARSQAVKNGFFSPWTSDPAEMYRKTVAKNGFKYVPKSIEMARAIALDNAQECGDESFIEFDIPEALPQPSDTVHEEPEKPSATEQIKQKVKEQNKGLLEGMEGGSGAE